jgi:hypothetical protein
MSVRKQALWRILYKRAPRARYLYLIPCIILLLAAPAIFSYAIWLNDGYYVRQNGTGPWEYVQNPWGIVIGIAAAFCIWLVALPRVIIDLQARPKTLKLDAFLCALLLFFGLIMLGWNLPLSAWFKKTFGLVIDSSYFIIEGIIWTNVAGISLIIDLTTYRKAFSQFLSNLTVVKRADVSLKRTDFHVMGYEEKSKRLVRKAKTLKFVFRLLSLLVIILCLYYVYQNITYFVGILLSIDLSLRGLLSGSIALVQNSITLYLVSIIPIYVVLVFISSLIIPSSASDSRLEEVKQGQFVELVRSEAKKLDVPVPKVAYKSNVAVLETIRCEKSDWILANPEMVDALLKNHPLELRVAIMHEFSHIINGDVNDKTRIYNVRSSLKLGTSRLMRVLGPLAVAFPLSVILVAGVPMPSTIAYYFTMMSFTIFLIGIAFSAELIRSGIRPVHVAPFLVSLFVGIIFLPLAIFWGKLDSLIQKRADLEATTYLKSKEQMISLLTVIQNAVRNDPKIVVREGAKEIGSIFQNESWKEYIFSVPPIILDGIYEYCQRYYSNISSRIDNLTHNEEIEYTKWTLLKRAISWIIGFFVDIPRNEGSRIALVLGLIAFPAIFIINYFPTNGNVAVSGIYTVITIIIIAKMGKYVLKLRNLIVSSLKNV